MKVLIGTTVAVVVVVALVAGGKDDIRRLYWMRHM